MSFSQTSRNAENFLLHIFNIRFVEYVKAVNSLFKWAFLSISAAKVTHKRFPNVLKFTANGFFPYIIGFVRILKIYLQNSQLLTFFGLSKKPKTQKMWVTAIFSKINKIFTNSFHTPKKRFFINFEAFGGRLKVFLLSECLKTIIFHGKVCCHWKVCCSRVKFWRISRNKFVLFVCSIEKVMFFLCKMHCSSTSIHPNIQVLWEFLKIEDQL